MAPAMGLGSPNSSMYHGAKGREDIYFPNNKRSTVEGGVKPERRDPWEMDKRGYKPELRGMEEEMKSGFFGRR